MSYFITRVDLNNQCSIADSCLTPLRWLCGGRAYSVIEGKRPGERVACSYGRVDLISQICRHIIGFLGTVILFPLVLIGLMIKAVSSDQKKNYRHIEQCIAKQIPMVRLDKLSLRPSPVELSPVEEKGIDSVNYIDLVFTWNIVGKDSIDYYNIRDRLNNWLQNEVPDTGTYTSVRVDCLEATKVMLEKNLKIITLLCQDPAIPDDRKRKVLQELYEASQVCTPTWVNKANEGCLTLKGKDLGLEKILLWVQDIKEQKILSWYRLEHWNILNSVKVLMGPECGLSHEDAAFDNTVGGYRLDDKKTLFRKFLHEVNGETMITELTERIRLANPVVIEKGKVVSDGIDSELNQLLAECANQHAKAHGLDITDEMYDATQYLFRIFYDDVTNKYPNREKHRNLYQINKEGAKALLIQAELVGF